MQTVQQQLEALMGLNADTELRFDDGVLPANSYVLSFFSSVLRNAVEAQQAADQEEGSSSSISIPMAGITKAQWLQAAPFWHPVEPAPAVQWDNLELLLKIGSRFDLRLVLFQASEFLAANVKELHAPLGPSFESSTPHSASWTGSIGDGAFDEPCSVVLTGSAAVPDLSVWKWLRLADELRLGCMPAHVTQAVAVDRAGCSNLANTQGLSAATLQRMVAALAGGVGEH